MKGVLEDFSAPTLITAIEANLAESWMQLACSPQAELHEHPDMTWIITGIPHPLFNGVFRTRIASGETDTRVRETLAHFKSRQVPMWWMVAPHTRPPDLGAYLVDQGFFHFGGATGMAVRLKEVNDEASPPSDLSIEHVGDAEILKEWARVVSSGLSFFSSIEHAAASLFTSAGLGLPWRYYIGLINGEPVASSALFLGAGVAGIYRVVTAPDSRGQGIGTAMTLAPLREAQDLGYRIGVLHASSHGISMYRRLGFREYCTIDGYFLEMANDQDEEE